jgi:[acyl-carrier-protein] S-malonyltransferase
LKAAVAFVFPGQGSQGDAMRGAVARSSPELLEDACELVGEDPFERVGDGNRFLQPAVFCACVAAWIELGSPAGDLYAGHSLGEYAALVAAGSMSAADALRVVVARGRAMQAAAESAPAPGGMLAVGLDRAAAEELAERNGLWVANDNSPDQVVLSGPRARLERVRDEGKARGLRSKMLPIAGALHSPAMAAAQPELERALAAVHVETPARPVISGVTAEPFDAVATRLVEGVTAPVRWREVLLALRARGARRFVEVGPGGVLSRLARRTLGDVETETAWAPEAVGA